MCWGHGEREIAFRVEPMSLASSCRCVSVQGVLSEQKACVRRGYAVHPRLAPARRHIVGEGGAGIARRVVVYEIVQFWGVLEEDYLIPLV